MRAVLALCFCLWLSPAGAITVVDALGRSISLPQPAQRVVALAPHIVENLFAIGAGDLVVGAVNYSNYPPQAATILQIGSYQNFSLEAIVALQPDLVIVWLSGNGEDSVRQLQNVGLPVFATEPRSLLDVEQSLRDMGQLTGRTQSADAAAQAFAQRLSDLRQQYSGGQPLRVMYQVWHDPLQTLNGQHIVSDVMQVCGARNAFAEVPVLAPKISVESVLAVDPDAIVASGMDKERPEWLDFWRKWPALTAVKQQRLYFVPPDLLQRHTPRLLDGAELLCQHLALP